MADEIIEPVTRADARTDGLRFYFTGRPCKRGHIGERSVATGHCLICERLRHQARHECDNYRKKRSERARRRRARPGYIEAEKEWYESPETQERLRAYRRSEDVKRRRRKYAKSPEGRRALSEREKRFRATPYGAAKEAARQLVRRSLQRAGSDKTARACDILGYSPDELAEHLESLFLDGMSWQNRSQWHIDHIRPLSSFDLATPEGIREANSLHNLRPMWAKYNARKSDKWNGVLTLPL